MGLDENLQAKFNDFVEFCDGWNQKEEGIKLREEFKNDDD
jgi:hypothetical protein